MERMNRFKRWIMMNQVMVIILLMIVLFAWMDTQQIIMLKQLDSTYMIGSQLWELWWGIGCRAQTILFYGILAAMGIIWYILSKDKSESLAIFLTPAALIWFGTQDLIYFALSPIDSIQANMGCWADIMLPIRVLSNIMGETCPTATSFVLSGVIGVFVAAGIYTYLQRK